MRWCTITSGRFDTFLADLVFRHKLANLVMLDLSDFDLKNLSLHALIDSLGSLQELYLDNVTISVSPTDLAHASSANISSHLKELSIWQCATTGGHIGTVLTSPQFHSMLTDLVTLEIGYYDLKNLSLHGLIDSFCNLQHLYLEHVNISASPVHLTHASSANATSHLKELRLSWCTITSGHFDTVLTRFQFLSMLTLDGTKFSGPDPILERFAEFPSLTVLSLRSCGLIGTTFPSSVFRIKSLTELDVSGNENLRGELPEFTQGSALQVLMLKGTKFSGNIPESVSNLRNLTELELSNCQFQGLLPSFAQWPMIRSADLSGNNLTGSLPSDGYRALRNLTYLSLRGCLDPFSHQTKV
jgi:Leucine-rich repeat (LRR) protein